MKLEIKNLSKTYGKKEALKNISLTLTEGVYGLLGPNGAGKSTFINILVDNIQRSGGEILVDGREIKENIKDYVDVIGFMPQQQKLYDTFTAYRYLSYMSALKGLKKAEAKKKIQEVLELVNLSDRKDEKIGGFSGGMKQRLLLAQALLGNPKILIMDEPTAGLDPKERIRIRNLIASVGFDKIVIIATHIVSDIEFIAEKIILFKEGNLIGYHEPAELLKQIHGNVFEIMVDNEQYDILKNQFSVSALYKEEGFIKMRLLVKEKTSPEALAAKLKEQTKKEIPCQMVAPNLDDYYLYVYNL